MPGFTIVQRTQHWRLLHGTFYRDCIVTTEAGATEVWAIRDDLTGGAA